MNKAFTKELDTLGGACPRCGSSGKTVADETLRAFARPDRADDVARPAYFCDVASCPVVYFDDFERTLTADDLTRPIWPKNPAAPVCGCFDFHVREIDSDLAEGTVLRTKQAVARSNGPEARCLLHSPDGRSCAEAIQRYYFKNRPGPST